MVFETGRTSSYILHIFSRFSNFLVRHFQFEEIIKGLQPNNIESARSRYRLAEYDPPRGKLNAKKEQWVLEGSKRRL